MSTHLRSSIYVIILSYHFSSAIKQMTHIIYVHVPSYIIVFCLLYYRKMDKICLNQITSTSADSRRVVVSYRLKYMLEVLVKRLVKLAQEKVGLGELIVSK